MRQLHNAYTKENWNRERYIEDYIKFGIDEQTKIFNKNGVPKHIQKKLLDKWTIDSLVPQANRLADTYEFGFNNDMSVMGIR